MSTRPKPPTTAGRKLAGASQVSGASWETTIDDALKFAVGRGTVRDYWFSYAKMAIIRKEGKMVAVFVGKGPPDLTILMASGEVVLAEAKQCDRAAWPFSELKEHQARRLTNWTAGDHPAGVLLSLRGAAWWLPWHALGPLWHAWASVARAPVGGAGLTPERCAAIGVRIVGMDVAAALSRPLTGAS